MISIIIKYFKNTNRNEIIEVEKVIVNTRSP